jgi:hypothetical protein
MTFSSSNLYLNRVLRIAEFISLKRLIDSLSCCLQVSNPTAGDFMSQVPMDDGLRQSLLQMLMAHDSSQPPPQMAPETPMMRSHSDQLRLSTPQPLTPHDIASGPLQSSGLTPTCSARPSVDEPHAQYGPYYMTPRRVVPLGHSLFATEGLHPCGPTAAITPRDAGTPRTPHGHAHPLSTPRGLLPSMPSPPLRCAPPLGESQSDRLPGPPTSRDKAFKLNSLPEHSEDRAASAPLPHGAGTGVFIPGVVRQQVQPPKRGTRTTRSARGQISAPLETQTSDTYDGLELHTFDRLSLSSELPWVSVLQHYVLSCLG